MSVDAHSTSLSADASRKRRSRDRKNSNKRARGAAYRLDFAAAADADKLSPVSGTVILPREAAAAAPPGECDGVEVSGDIDASVNCVEVTAEARAELEKIDNRIGDYICRLCRQRYDDAFRLAQHRCSRIVHVEYRCPDCDKVFSCPANLASHRRWHKPGASAAAAAIAKKKPTKKPHNNNNNNLDNDDADSTARGSLSPLSLSDDNNALDLSAADPGLKVSPDGFKVTPDGHETAFECVSCGKTFRRRSYLRKHVATVHQAPQTSPPAPPKDCLYCPDSFKTELERSRHVIASHGIQRLIQQREGVVEVAQPGAADPSASYLCKYCPDTFASLSTLTGHVTKNHSLDSRQVAVMTM